MLERELFQFLEKTADAAFTVNDLGLIRSWNHAAERLFGYRAAEVLDKPCAPLFQGRDALGASICTEPCAVLDCVRHDREVADFDMEAVARSGKRVPVNVSILPFHDRRTGRRLIVHLARDIGKKKNREILTQKLITLARRIASLPDDSDHPAPVSPLSEQECRILHLLAQGRTAESIARELRVTPHTLRNYLHHANLKLHTRNRLEAVAQAKRRRLI